MTEWLCVCIHFADYILHILMKKYKSYTYKRKYGFMKNAALTVNLFVFVCLAPSRLMIGLHYVCVYFAATFSYRDFLKCAFCEWMMLSYELNNIIVFVFRPFYKQTPSINKYDENNHVENDVSITLSILRNSS